MDPRLGLALLIAAAAATAMVATTTAASPATESKWVLSMGLTTSTCDGSVGDCIEPEEETMMMESEGAHRQLWDNRRYISYNAMNKNNIPCNQAGTSYYNCRRNNANNPYRRGCTAITMCARTW